MEFDIVLVDAFAHGSSAAFDELYRRHAGRILQFGWKLVGSQSVAEDLLQETFLTLWTKRRRVRVVDESILPWLLVTCRNHARNAMRRTARHHTVPLLDTDQIADPGDHSLVELLAGLTRTDRSVIQLCLLDGYSYREAAEQLDSSPAAVGKRVQRARAKLREAIAND